MRREGLAVEIKLRLWRVYVQPNAELSSSDVYQFVRKNNVGAIKIKRRILNTSKNQTLLQTINFDINLVLIFFIYLV